MRLDQGQTSCISRWCGGRFWGLATGVTLGLLAFPSHAVAQTRIEGEFSVQRLDLASGRGNFLGTRGLRMTTLTPWTFGVTESYGYRPFDVENRSLNTTVRVVESLYMSDHVAAWVPRDDLQVSARLPIGYVRGQGITTAGQPQDVGHQIDSAGLGDLQLEGKYRFLGGFEDALTAGAALYLNAPLGNLTAPGTYLGDGTAGVGFRAIVDGQSGVWRWGANLGGFFRGDAQVGDASMGSELRYSLAGSLMASPVTWVMADLNGSTRFTDTRGATALEALAAVRVRPWRWPLDITVGGGTSFLQGIGAPQARVLLGVQVYLDERDLDRDGVDDAEDVCPDHAGPRDGGPYNGCPNLGAPAGASKPEGGASPSDGNGPVGVEAGKPPKPGKKPRKQQENGESAPLTDEDLGDGGEDE